MSELLPEPATPVTATSTPSGTSTETSWRLWRRACRIGIEPVGSRTRSLSDWRTSRWSAGQRAGARQAVERALVDDLAAVRAGARAHVDDVVGDGHDVRLVLDDEDGVALVAQLLEQPVHLLDVVGVEADRRLVEDVGHVGQRRAEVADHPRPLRFAAGQRRRLALEARGSPSPIVTKWSRTVASWSSAGRASGASIERTHASRSLICIAATSAIDLPVDLRRAGERVQPRAAARRDTAPNVAIRSTAARMCGWSDSSSFTRYARWIRSTRPW